MGRVWPRHGHRGRPLNSVVSHQFAQMGRASAIAQIVILLAFPVVAFAFAYLVWAASSAPSIWALGGIVVGGIGFVAFSYARLSAFRARGIWAWGTRGMLPTSRKLYWGGYILMVASAIVVVAAALAHMATQ